MGDNERLTRTGPNTPMGQTFRHYWMPALLSRELPHPDCAPVRMQLLGEDFVAFRDSDGKVGIVAPRCRHRGANLFFGRNEECGLRCIYHGWKFDRHGKCVDIPNASPDVAIRLMPRASIRALTVEERGDVVWAFSAMRRLLYPTSNISRCRRNSGLFRRNFNSATGRKPSKAVSTLRTSRIFTQVSITAKRRVYWMPANGRRSKAKTSHPIKRDCVGS